MSEGGENDRWNGIVSEESFAGLIGIIFVYEAFDKMLDIRRQRPVRLHTVESLPNNCTCSSSNWTSYRYPNTTISVRHPSLSLEISSFEEKTRRNAFDDKHFNLIPLLVTNQYEKHTSPMCSSSRLFSSFRHLS